MIKEKDVEFAITKFGWKSAYPNLHLKNGCLGVNNAKELIWWYWKILLLAGITKAWANCY